MDGRMVVPHVINPTNLPPGYVETTHYTEVKEVPIDPTGWNTITDAMSRVLLPEGTAPSAHIPGVDIAGKTGTTNEAHDAWFSGFNGDLVTTVWVGFDQDRSLGPGEEGGRTAVPIWTYFMREALAGTPRHPVPVPDGLVTVRINPETGLLASADNPNGIMEKFVEGNLPKPELYEGPNTKNPMNDGDKPLF